MNDALGSPQTVLVLGGGSDLARAIVRRLVARRTEAVILAGRAGSPSVETAATEARVGGAATVETVAFDAAEPSTHAAIIDGIWERHPEVDLVLVAFGVLGDQQACEETPAAAIEVAAVNYAGAVTAGLAVARHLREQGHGTLVALSSVAGTRARRANYVYGSSKAGMDAFYQGLGDALAGTGARVVLVRPGFVATKMTRGKPPAPFATTPDAVADAVLAALAAGRPAVWVPPMLRWVMAVLRMLPRPAWRRITRV